MHENGGVSPKWALDQFRQVELVLRRVMADGDTPFPPPTCDENHASFRAKATLARFVPRHFATSMPQRFISENLITRDRITLAAS